MGSASGNVVRTGHLEQRLIDETSFTVHQWNCKGSNNRFWKYWYVLSGLKPQPAVIAIQDPPPNFLYWKGFKDKDCYYTVALGSHGTPTRNNSPKLKGDGVEQYAVAFLVHKACSDWHFRYVSIITQMPANDSASGQV